MRGHHLRGQQWIALSTTVVQPQYLTRDIEGMSQLRCNQGHPPTLSASGNHTLVSRVNPILTTQILSRTLLWPQAESPLSVNANHIPSSPALVAVKSTMTNSVMPAALHKGTIQHLDKVHHPNPASTAQIPSPPAAAVHEPQAYPHQVDHVPCPWPETSNALHQWICPNLKSTSKGIMHDG